MRLLNHLATIDGCQLIDGCRDRIYSPYVPGVRRSTTGNVCETCCCEALTSVCDITVDKDQVHPFWRDGSDTMEGFYGFQAETVDYNTAPGGTAGVLTVFGRFRADNLSSLAKGMQLYRRTLDTECGDCLKGSTLRVADHCPGDCVDGCTGWLNLHGMTLSGWSEVDDGTRTGCVQPVALTWQTRCPTGYRETCRGTISLDGGNELDCGLSVCTPIPGDDCEPCDATVIPSQPRVYRGCWCRPVYQTAAGCRITPPVSCGSDVALALQVKASNGSVSNLRAVVWRTSPGWPGPWTYPGRAHYNQFTPAADLRINHLDTGDTATLTPWDGASRTCGPNTRRDGVEGPLGTPVTIPTAQVGEEIAVVLYGDTAQNLAGVTLEWVAYETIKL